MNSSGSAMEENEKRADSLKVKTASLKREIEELVLGDGGLNSFLKALLSSGTGILKFINTTKALPVILTDIAIIIGTALYPKLILFGKTLIATIGNIIMFTAETGSLSAGLKSVGISITSTQLAIGALTAVVSIGVLAWNAYKTSQENARMQAEQNAEKLESEAKSIDEVIDKIKNENLNREELITAIDSVNSKYSEELQSISDINELRKEGIDLLAKESAEKIKAAQTAIASEVTEAKKALSSSSSVNLPQTVGTKYLGEPSSIVDRGIGSYKFADPKEQTKALQEATEAAKKNVEAGTEQQYVLNELNKAYNNSKEAVDGWNATLEQDQKYTDALTNAQKENSDAVANSSDTLYDYFNDLDETQIDELAKALKISSDEFIENANAMGLSLSQYGEYETANQQIQKATEDTNSSIDGLQSALGVAKQALEEYNESGSLTLDTFQSLLSISPDYLTALINENGQVTLNQETLGNLVEQLKIAKIEELQNAAAADILALANGNVNDMSDTAKKAVSELGDNISESGDQANTASGKMLGFAASVLSAVNASKGLETGELPEDFESKQKAIIDAYQKIGDKISGISVDTTNNVAKEAKKGTKASKGAAKSTTDAYKEEYQKQLDDLDHKLAMGEMKEGKYYNSLQDLNEKYFGVASGQHEKYLDEYQKNQEKIYTWQKKQEEENLKAQKQTYDKAIDYIKDNLNKKADLIKKDKENELDSIDEEIEYLEEKRDKKLDYIEDEIDAIKEEKDTFVDNIETQIDSLEKLKDKEEEEWESKINAYEEANSLLSENIELQKLQEALAQAKSKKVQVLRDGKFTYEEDESAVSEAQQSIDDYYTDLKQEKELQALEDSRDAALAIYEEQISSLQNYKETMSDQYDEQIETLEEKRDQIQEYYDNRIEDMKEYRTEVEEEYDAQIETMENYIDNFETMVGAYDEKQNKLALIQVAGANAEKDVWVTRLENLKDFVNEYNALQEELGSDSTDNDVSYSPKESKSLSVGARASGDSSVKNDSFSLIGDDKNKQELLVGGKLNGSLMKLSKGDGVVNSKSLNTFAGLLNSLPSSLGFGNVKDSDKKEGAVNTLHIDIVNVQADNAMNFIDSMAQQFNIGMKQDTFKLSGT